MTRFATPTRRQRSEQRSPLFWGRRAATSVPTVVGTEVAALLGQNPDSVFKTLVTVGSSKTHYVFVVPVNRELDLKKAAKCVGEKKIDMIKSKELLPLTGYIHGGCSPIGMKKFFRTVIHETAKNFDRIYFSAGRIGYQVGVRPEDIEKVIKVEFADISC
ncbi:MAG: Cys-tRNA(Pro) deacylase [Acutalibacteraceae bacterium]